MVRMPHWSPREATPNVAAVAAGDQLLDPSDTGSPMAPAASAASVGPVRGHVRRAMQEARVAATLFVSLVVLNALDLLTTRMVLDRGGEEGNPIMAPIVHNLAAATLIKALCLALIWALILRSQRSPRMLVVIGAVNVWYAIVIVWNLKVLLHLW
jgi:hypothetical protein